jgi:hypothetical protein
MLKPAGAAVVGQVHPIDAAAARQRPRQGAEVVAGTKQAVEQYHLRAIAAAGVVQMYSRQALHPRRDFVKMHATITDRKSTCVV